MFANFSSYSLDPFVLFYKHQQIGIEIYKRGKIENAYKYQIEFTNCDWLNFKLIVTRACEPQSSLLSEAK